MCTVSMTFLQINQRYLKLRDVTHTQTSLYQAPGKLKICSHRGPILHMATRGGGAGLGHHFYLYLFIFYLCLWHVEAPGPGIEPMPHQRPEPQQWHCQTLNPDPQPAELPENSHNYKFEFYEFQLLEENKKVYIYDNQIHKNLPMFFSNIKEIDHVLWKRWKNC